tara:strand:+ start:2656 stop:3744 length:1089 start_codon:yes stop_codon:yes gene_type:complete
MVTAQKGILTTNNEGSFSNTGGTGERVLIDYKDALIDYKVTALPALQMFTERMNTDTGGKIDITFTLPSMAMEQIDEGTTPAYQHTKLRSERVDVREWGMAVGVTRRMIEDSRFNEVELALNEARRSVERHITKHTVYALFGLYDATLGTGLDGHDIYTNSPESGSSSVTDFSANIYGGFIASGGTVGSGRLYNYGLTSDADLVRTHYQVAASTSAGKVSLSDITKAIDIIGAEGYNADTIVISPAHYKSLLDMADFTVALTANTPRDSGGQLGFLEDTAGNGFVGTIYGLKVFTNAYIPSNRYGVFDMSVKPMAYVERRPLTVEEANPGFGIVGSYLSMRYGLKIVRPETGVIFINTGFLA